MPSRARSLAEDLRYRTDDQLELLFDLRPDLLRPVPKSFSDLALKVNSAALTLAALDDLTAAELDVLEAGCALAPAGKFSAADLAIGLDQDPAVIRPIVTALYDRVLLWGGDDDLRVPSTVRELLGPFPGGLDPVVRANLPGVRQMVSDPELFEARVRSAPQEARDLLVRAAWGPPTISPSVAGWDWLSEQEFMACEDSGALVVPREIALLLRRGQLIADPRLPGPVLPAPVTKEFAAADDHAGHAADQLVRDTDRVLAYLAAQTVARQANGAIPARDWERLTDRVRIPPARIGLILLSAWGARWIDWDQDSRMRPTTDYADHLDDPIADRWAALTHAWIGVPRAVTADPARLLKGGDEAMIPTLRKLVLAGLREGAGRDTADWLTWYRPRLQPSPALVGTVLADCEALGLTFAGVPSAALRASPGDERILADALAPSLPTLGSQVIMQADLTATSLGPLDPSVERRLGEAADWESGGGAAVFRFTPDSVRNALAAGADPTELIEWLESISTTGIPQALSVLIADQAAGLPAISVHPGPSVITAPVDQVAELLADAELAGLGLRQIAPGVLVSQQACDEVARRLRAAGRAATQPDAAPAVLASHRPVSDPAADRPVAARVIHSLRGVDERPGMDPQAPGVLPPIGSAELQTALREAVASHRRLWLSFAGDDGQRLIHLMEPLDLHGGDVCAFDVTAGEIRTIPLERIVASAAG